MNSMTVRLLLAMTVATCLGCHARPSGVPTQTLVPEAGVEVPLTFPDGRPVIEARINGRGPFRFLLDTGAPSVVLDASTARKCGAPFTSDISVLVDAAGRELRGYHRARVDEMMIGDAAFGDFDALVFDLATLPGAGGAPVDGVLGLRLFRQCCLTIDAPAARCRLDRTGLVALDADSVQIPPVDQQLMIPIKIEVPGRTITCQVLLDTGYSASLSLPAADQGQFGQVEEVGVLITTEPYHVQRVWRLPGRMWLRSSAIARPRVVFSDDRPRVGIEVLRQFRMVLDQRVRLLKLTPAALPSDN